ncbi:ketopantoate reductase family protein [Leifsonia virtsii]|uniref:Ketopantoate reductase C-terminal domain-containing protein n=1 Tax=Leifsonia virtsii TaxID=3035915 RepID=A0ABT8IV71_9MICO|nr:ketopantoate reductase C-terminal domain-containing protein [Leifsonia virtsii]MDN4596705.1 ketopantoate reductase C-terminal domain-containing protein [Leifsonia virtsii]
MVASIPPSYRTSLKEDHDKGRPTEVKAQIMDVLALGTSAGVEMPAYRRIVDALSLAQLADATARTTTKGH